MAVVVAAWPGPAGLCAAAAGPTVRPEQVDAVVEKAKAYLLAQLGPDGRCVTDTPPKDIRHGGKTALVVYALAEAGVDPREEPLARAVAWLAKADAHGTYAVAMRAMALAAVNNPQHQDLLNRDAQWLVAAANDQGGYSYGSAMGRPSISHDNSNAQMAVLGVYAAMGRGVKVPMKYWQTVEKYWTAAQENDGGWPYARTNPDRPGKTYGSMTAAGLATMFLCFEVLHAEDYVACAVNPPYRPVERAVRWLGENYVPGENPRLGTEYYYYWLYSIDRVGRAGGIKYFRGHDWYADGVSELVQTQREDGHWGHGDYTADTAFALLFLARGRSPILVNKLRYPGRWDVRPRDAAHLAEWLSKTFERRLSWQIVDISSDLRDWHDAPILYLSGAGAVQFTDAQILKLRTYALQGGLLLSESACNDFDFTVSMQRAYQRMFPDRFLTRLAADDPVYSLNFPTTMRGLMGVSNGVRLLAIHCPQQVSLGLQLGPQAPYLPQFNLMANIYLTATGRGLVRPRGEPIWPVAEKLTPGKAIRVARLRHARLDDPEPMAWTRLAILMAQRTRFDLIVSAPMDIEALSAQQWPIAAMTGTTGFRLTPAEREGLRKYFADGGVLIVDAAGRSQAFADAVEQQIVPLIPQPSRGLLAYDALLRGPQPMETFLYRTDYSLLLGRNKHESRIEALASRGRIAMIFSPDDITTGLVGSQWVGVKGFAPDTAAKMMINLLANLATGKVTAPL